MTKYLLDAVKTAIAIHNGDYSSLRGKYFVIRDKIKKKYYHSGDYTMNNPNEGKMTLAKLAIEMRAGFKQVNSRIDKLEKRIDSIDARLDYIVEANNLKDNK